MVGKDHAEHVVRLAVHVAAGACWRPQFMNGPRARGLRYPDFQNEKSGSQQNESDIRFPKVPRKETSRAFPRFRFLFFVCVSFFVKLHIKIRNGATNTMLQQTAGWNLGASAALNPNRLDLGW